MALRMHDGFMSLEINGTVIATARELAGGWWQVALWFRLFDRNQAITALTIIELLEATGRRLPE